MHDHLRAVGAIAGDGQRALPGDQRTGAAALTTAAQVAKGAREDLTAVVAAGVGATGTPAENIAGAAGALEVPAVSVVAASGEVVGKKQILTF